MRLLPNYPKCFICGHKNDTGLQASFFREENKVIVRCTFNEHHAGYEGIVHGGLISSILDEALGRIVTSITGKMVVTGELNVRFHRPIPIGSSIEIVATMDAEQKHPNLFWNASGMMFDINTHEKYASSTGRFFAIPEKKYPEILATLKLEDENRPVTMQDL